MDGRAPGLGLIAAVSFAVLAALNRSPYAVLLDLALAGSALAYVCRNTRPDGAAKDGTEGLFLGYALAVAALTGSCKTGGAVMASGSILALGIPLFEAFMLLASRHLGGFPLVGTDLAYAHHRPSGSGLTPRQTAGFLYLGSLCCMAAAILGNVIPVDSVQSLIPAVIVLFTLGGIMAAAGYSRSIMNRYGFRKDTMRCMALARYASMCLAQKASLQEMQRVLNLMARELGLLFLELRVDGGRLSLSSTGVSWDPQPVLKPGDEMKLNLNAADGSFVELFFQCKEKRRAALQHSINACLAHAFGGLRIGIPHGQESTAPRVPMPSPASNAKEFRPALVKQAIGR
jgi:hypothetical protein